MLEKTRIKYLINRESAKKNLKKGKKVKFMSSKSLKYPFIFIKIGIPLQKGLVLWKYTRNKPDFSPTIGPFSYTKALK